MFSRRFPRGVRSASLLIFLLCFALALHNLYTQRHLQGSELVQGNTSHVSRIAAGLEMAKGEGRRDLAIDAVVGMNRSAGGNRSAARAQGGGRNTSRVRGSMARSPGQRALEQGEVGKNSSAGGNRIAGHVSLGGIAAQGVGMNRSKGGLEKSKRRDLEGITAHGVGKNRSDGEGEFEGCVFVMSPASFKQWTPEYRAAFVRWHAAFLMRSLGAQTDLRFRVLAGPGFSSAEFGLVARHILPENLVRVVNSSQGAAAMHLVQKESCPWVITVRIDGDDVVAPFFMDGLLSTARKHIHAAPPTLRAMLVVHRYLTKVPPTLQID